MNTNNLLFEMKRRNVSRKQIAHALGICKHSVDNRFTGRCEFTVSELIEIRDRFFPYCTLDYLAGRMPIFYEVGTDRG